MFAAILRPVPRDPRYDILFEPVRIGPVLARNRFLQVPHCNGMGYRDPTAQAAMRRVKAEGGWAVVCTEQVEIHPTSDVTPFIELRLWDDGDIPALARIADAIHDGGALAGIELAHNGPNAPNLTSREPPLGPSALPVRTWANDPVQARAMTKDDIAALRRWHRAAARRALAAGYDLVYVYAGHGLSVAQHFLSPATNTRTDAYGGSLENRMRLLRELLTDTREECDGRAAVACRLTVDELVGAGGLRREEVEQVLVALDPLPDLWDLVLGTWELDSCTSRFGPEAGEEPFVAGLRRLVTKPVVGVGRFTSPDTMVRQIREGVLDLIGAARPSIADPWLPRKIEEGRVDDIRECIGCNICVSGDMTMSTVRCTQNPSMGEEWRRGWHPERIRPRACPDPILVVGAGPAGLEAARALGQRGYPVVVVEASRTLGGRVAKESGLPGLAAWRRVVDWRTGQLDKLEAVEDYRESPTTAEEALGYGFARIVVATGARWRADGVGRWHTAPIPIDPDAAVLTPDDLWSAAPALPPGARVLLYDDDHYYLGGVLAESLVAGGYDVRLVTPASVVSSWTANTLELERVNRRVRELGVTVDTDRALAAVGPGEATTICTWTGRSATVAADIVVLVTARLPVDDLHTELLRRRADWDRADLRSVTCVGDALAPGTIAAAVWSGRRYAEDLDGPAGGLGDGPDGGQAADPAAYRREYTALAPWPPEPSGVTDE